MSRCWRSWRAIYEQYQVGGRVAFSYDTRLYYGQLTS